MNSDKLIDLHTHTTFSDGELSPEALIRLAIEKGIGILAITDHDTIDGIKSINKRDKLITNSNIIIINGIELSVKYPKGTMHILGYNIDINSVFLNKKLDLLKDYRVNRFLSIMEQIKRDYGILFTYEDIKRLINTSHTLGRPDLAKLCVKYGYADSVKEAFDKYLIEAFNKIKSFQKGMSYQECLDLIVKSGGVPVLAHPKSLELQEKELLILIKDMINYGLKGLEVYHSSHTQAEQDYYLKISNQYNLLVSGGSDYHGPIVKPEIELGTGINNNINIKKLSLLNKMNF